MSDLSILNDSKHADEILDGIIDSLCSSKNAHYAPHKDTWTLEQWWALTDSWKQFCKECISEELIKDQIETRLANAGVNKKEELASIILKHKADLRRSLYLSTLEFSKAVLTDFDWQMKLMVSSDRLASIQEPVLSLDLMTKGENDANQHNVVEFSKDQLKQFISSLEAANKAINQLQT